MPFALIEPLRDLFKDEVRRIGADLGLPREILTKQPFPGGLAVRVLGEVTPEKLALAREADAIVIEEIWHTDITKKRGNPLPCYCRCAASGLWAMKEATVRRLPFGWWNRKAR